MRLSASSIARLATCGRPVLMQAAVKSHKRTAFDKKYIATRKDYSIPKSEIQTSTL